MRKAIPMPLWLAILLCVVCSLGGCQSYKEKRRGAANARREARIKDSLALKVAVMPTIDCLPIYVAADYNLFDTLGLKYSLKHFNAQMDCDTAFVGGCVEMMVSDRVRCNRIMKNGVGVTYLATTNLSWQLISNRTSRLKRMEQLGDRMVAMTRHSATDKLTDDALKGVKTQAQVFRLQVNDVTLRLAMLLGTEVDAAWLPEPQATAARLHGGTILTSSEQLSDKGEKLGVIVARSDAVKDENRKKQIGLFQKAYNAACDSIKLHGTAHYSKLLTKYCHADDKTIGALPKMQFEHMKEAKTPESSKEQKSNK